MNKTISVNIGGRVFNIEVLAYDRLNLYLNTIRSYFGKGESTDEIIADIELRIAELFLERITNQKQVVTEKDVDDIISIMGKPEDYVEEDPEGNEGFTKTNTTGSHRRVFRDPDNKVALGVCSGISAYFGIDPIILRALFVLSFIFYGSGLLLYLVLALIIPKAKTTAEKLQMHGEPVTVENISRKVSESFNDVKEDIKDFGKKNGVNEKRFSTARSQGSEFLRDVFDNLGKTLKVLLVIVIKIIGVCLIIGGVCAIFASMAFYFGWENIIVFMNEGTLNSNFFPSVVNNLFTSQWGQNLFTLGALITLLVPAIGFLLLGFSMLFDFRKIPIWIGIILVVVWFGGIAMLSAGSTDIYNQFKVKTAFTEDVPLEFSNTDTLYLDILNNKKSSYKFTHTISGGSYHFDSNVTFPGVNSTDILYMGETEFTIEMNRADSLFHLVLYREARGSNQKDAVVNAQSIVSYSEIAGDSLLINPYFVVLDDGKFRYQDNKYILRIPIGKSIHLNPNSRQIIDDIPNTTDTYDGKMVGHTWTMTPDGLSNPYFEKKYDKHHNHRRDDD